MASIDRVRSSPRGTSTGLTPECPRPRRGPPQPPPSPRFPDVALPLLPARVQRGGLAIGMARPSATPEVLVPPRPVHWRLSQ